MTPSRLPDAIGVVARRAPLLEHLADAPARKPALVDQLDCSRSTIDRAIRELEAAGLVERTREGYTTTQVGRLLTARYRRFGAEQESILAARELLAAVPETVELPRTFVTDARCITEGATTELFELAAEQLGTADRCRILLPSLPGTRFLRLCRTETVRGDLDVELVASDSLADRLGTEFPQLTAELVDHGDVAVSRTETDLGVVLFEQTEASTATATAVVAAFDDSTVRGLSVTSEPSAVDWARHHYEQRRAAAEDCTEQLRTACASRPLPQLSSDRLPPQLRTEGFARVDDEQLEQTPHLSPTTAWRTGLGLSAVAAGYAVSRRPAAGRAREDRRCDTDVSAPDDAPRCSQPADHAAVTHADPEREQAPAAQTLTEQVLARLQAGTDCALVGPAGSGKSTVAKRVAVEWVRQDCGRALYRATGAGQPVDSVRLLEDVLDRTPAPVLVVVEDAVRSQASAVLQAMVRLGRRDDVVFLLDACEHEWTAPKTTDARVQRYRQEAVETIPLPSIDATDCRRIVEQAETITGERLSVPPETLLEDVRSSSADTGSGQPGTMVLLFDRLARALESLPADGADSRPEQLTEAVDRSRTVLAELGDVALDVGLVAHLCNAADLPVTRAVLYAPVVAASDIGQPAPDQLSTINAALSHLEDTVPTGRTDPARNAVHRSWSVRFLTRLLETDEVTTRRRFDRCVSAVLALAADPDHRRALRQLIGDDDGLAAIEAAPTRWAEETARGISAAIERHAQLAPLCEPPATTAFELPDSCSIETVLRHHLSVARTWRAAGTPDKARAAFERLEALGADCEAPVGTRYRIEALLGQATVARRRSRYEAARDHLDAAKTLAAEIRSHTFEARCQYQRGLVARSTEAFDEALAQFEAARRTFQKQGHTKREADALRRHGETRAMQAELSCGPPEHLESVIEALETSLARYRDIGDRAGRADARRWLGQVRAVHPDEDPQAACHEHRAVVDLARQLGDRDREAKARYALGDAWFAADDLSRARSQFETALSLFADADRAAWTVIVRRRLGILATLTGAFDRATALLERARSTLAGIDRPVMETRVSRALSMASLYAHDLETAAEAARDSLDQAETLGDGTRVVRACESLGRVQLLAGDLDAAKRTATRLRAAARAYDVDGTAAKLLAPIAFCRGNYAAAREHAERGLEGPESDGRYPLVLGRVALVERSLQDARGQLSAVIERQHGDEHRYWTQHALVDRARVHRHAGELPAAADDLEAARKHNDEYPYPLVTARIDLQRGALARTRGELDRAAELLEQAANHCDNLESPELLSRVQFERAQLELARENGEAARSLLETAVERARSVGARQQEARLLAALVETRSGSESSLEQYRERYRTLDCDHLPVDGPNAPPVGHSSIAKASQTGAGRTGRRPGDR